MAITFGGLASGIDTGSIIEELMNIERAPIDRLENDKDFYQSRLKAFSDLEGKLKSFLDAAEAIDSVSELNSPAVAASSEEFLTATADSKIDIGSYQVTVAALAQQQKDVSAGYADKFANTFGTGTLSLTVGGEAHSIDITSENNSLDGIAQAIEDAGVGVSATIINDGTGTPYRLVLTGESVSETFSLDSSGLTGGTEANPAMTTTQSAQQAHIIVDGIDIYSDSNTVDSAIPGLSMELLKADPVDLTPTTLNVSSDNEATKGKIQSFVNAYNSIVNFISEQKDADWGNDSAFRSVKRRMQDLLVSSQDTGGTFSTLSQVGFETQRDGTITLSSASLESALTEDYDSVMSLLTGGGTSDGIAAEFAAYLDAVTDSGNGIYASRKESTESNVRRIDQRIDVLELRMEQREKTLRAQFSAMEELVSGMNSQGTFLAQQLAALNYS